MRRPVTSRQSRITTGTVLLHGDLHNHSLFSDGSGDPEQAFVMMREAALDVAALTDHASIPHHAIPDLDPAVYPDEEGMRRARAAPRSFDEAGWRRTAELADAADVPGEFTAIRGFEWTEPWLGHANVWFSHGYHDVQRPGVVEGLHEWLSEHEPDALFGYNHTGREPGRFGDFTFLPALGGRMVALEAFNRTDDYLFGGCEDGGRPPIAACLDAGWRPGLIGVSDEHGPDYGVVGRGRTGIWAGEHSRDGVREALLSRRTFATREVGLRLDATLGGVRMGGNVETGRQELAVDLDAGERWSGALELQVLVPGEDGLPQPLLQLAVDPDSVTRTEIELPAGTRWAFVRVADASRRNRWPGPEGHCGNAYGVAYASPWYPR